MKSHNCLRYEECFTCILLAASLFCHDVSHWSGGSCPESPRQNYAADRSENDQ